MSPAPRKVYGLCVVWDCFHLTPRMRVVFLSNVGTAPGTAGPERTEDVVEEIEGEGGT